jgi:biotin transport system substrate-specific component
MLALMLFANFVLIHGLGFAQLWLWVHLVDGSEATLASLFWMGTIPFLPGDVAKAIVAATVASAMILRKPHTSGIDANRSP